MNKEEIIKNICLDAYLKLTKEQQITILQKTYSKEELSELLLNNILEKDRMQIKLHESNTKIEKAMVYITHTNRFPRDKEMLDKILSILGSEE